MRVCISVGVHVYFGRCETTCKLSSGNIQAHYREQSSPFREEVIALSLKFSMPTRKLTMNNQCKERYGDNGTDGGDEGHLCHKRGVTAIL